MTGSPPPHDLGDAGPGYEAVMEVLDDTAFASFDPEQMLATAREIEDRAWRHGEGTLLAEERAPDEYHGFWTYDAERVDGLEAYLRDAYG